MREKILEQKLVKAVKALGGISPKFVSPGLSGMPDRIVLLPDGKVGFVEVKAPGKKPRALQVVRHEKLKCLGFRVFILDEVEQIGEVLNAIQTT
ncbi:VRR-NUC domain-containing protein [uncultured Phascolarctobacterium sp.]|uniref:VRR-NUC domain-containing protein n=1 Tax=uncultured Phascolarctobacterium sp. TaxID=512296 RepID=UPI0027D9A1FE|nr:VRR-NUC domain-containing protein [uncultured Phascolarctobacterium sp.]